MWNTFYEVFHVKSMVTHSYCHSTYTTHDQNRETAKSSYSLTMYVSNKAKDRKHCDGEGRWQVCNKDI